MSSVQDSGHLPVLVLKDVLTGSHRRPFRRPALGLTSQHFTCLILWLLKTQENASSASLTRD